MNSFLVRLRSRITWMAAGLALFYVETRDADGLPRGMRMTRLKDKLGTRKVPTAELLLEGAPAELVKSTDHGVRDIVPMLVELEPRGPERTGLWVRPGVGLAFEWVGGQRRQVHGLHRVE